MNWTSFKVCQGQPHWELLFLDLKEEIFPLWILLWFNFSYINKVITRKERGFLEHFQSSLRQKQSCDLSPWNFAPDDLRQVITKALPLIKNLTRKWNDSFHRKLFDVVRLDNFFFLLPFTKPVQSKTRAVIRDMVLKESQIEICGVVLWDGCCNSQSSAYKSWTRKHTSQSCRFDTDALPYLIIFAV